MRVLLIDPPNQALRGGGGIQVHPLGLGYLAAMLEPYHDVRQLICDLGDYQGGDPWPTIAAAITEEAPDLVGIGSVTATFGAAMTAGRLVRSLLGPSVPIVLGGVHPTFRPEEALTAPVDYLVRGEGEHTLLELVDTLESGGPTEAIAGLWQRDPTGAIIKGPARPPMRDLDALPFPSRRGVVWPERIQPAFYQSIITLRGCPYRCIYCAIPASADKLTRYRSAGNVADEIAHLVEHHQIPYLFFHDSVFTLNRKRTLAVFDALKQRGIQVPFACQTRADRVDQPLLERMTEAGCHQIFFGIESGHAESLERVRKDMPLETIRDAVARVKAQNIRCTGFFMVGFPWETEEHIRATADFATDLDLDAVSLFSATPLPGTELWDISSDVVLPESIDFRKPEVNLTSMDSQAYADLYTEVSEVLVEYNRAQMGRALTSWPRG